MALDGGGTKTVAVITDDSGKVLASGRSGTANYHVAGKENVKQMIVKLILDVIARSGACDSAEICFQKAVFALAGIDTKKDKENVEEIVREAITESGIRINHVMIENDALSVLLGVTNNNPGVILIAGTGSIVYAHDGNNHFVRSGGVGHKLGDEGAGYWIGKEAIRAILKMHDGRGPKTILHELVLAHFRFSDHEEIIDWVYSTQFSIHEVGALAKIVEQAYIKGDAVSQSIIEHAINELYQLVVAAVKRAGIAEKPFKLLLLGGLLQNSNFIKEQLLEKLKETMPNIELITTNNKPIDFIIQRLSLKMV